MGHLRSRAAILPYPGDPFLLNYWLDNFRRIWLGEIDRLYIVCNTPAEEPVIDYIRTLCARYGSKIRLYMLDHHIQHGDAIKLALDDVKEDNVLLIEDDCYIIRPGAIDEQFLLLENDDYDLIGSKRGSCHPEILKAAQDVFGISYEGHGDQGPNFWPNLFLIRRNILEATDGDMNARSWERNQKITALNNYDVIAPVVASDTFGHTSLQLRQLVPESRIHYIPQYHAAPEDYQHYENSTGIFDGKAPWVHIGSLSSGASGAIMDDFGRSIAKRTKEPPKEKTILPPEWCDVNSEFAKMEWERRVQWWLTFWERREPGQLDEYADLYKKGLDRIISQYNLSSKRILQRQGIYKTLGL